MWFKDLIEWLERIWEYIKFFHILNQYEGGVILRLGKFNRVMKESWNWKLFMFEECHTCITKPDTMHIEGINITTIDGKPVSVGAIIEFDIQDVKLFLLEYNETLSNAHDITRSVVADYLSDCTWEEVKKKSTWTGIKNKLKSEYERMGMKLYFINYGDCTITKVITLNKNF